MKNCECPICGKIFDETNSKKPKLSLKEKLTEYANIKNKNNKEST